MVKYFLIRILLLAFASENSASSLFLHHSAVDVSVCSGPVKEIAMTQKCLENILFLLKKIASLKIT